MIVHLKIDMQTFRSYIHFKTSFKRFSKKVCKKTTRNYNNTPKTTPRSGSQPEKRHFLFQIIYVFEIEIQIIWKKKSA